ncbi:vitamin K epoxide reductase family protein [Rhodococcus sp. IEGM 1351]|uniref:vitamin K epoxide reductase family protein n=1 Tax=Rhodococcus sp. IEGM 1351 TaxID=3047089 RepID=UPI0024B7FE6A|nr:vitamin K epoxide reductase family protein [Rhodococcus sp. IEGM 1351]MDI9938902.1 vitamin K epoxide reductase family protein [Rhodococcus sp. IEGM 1351]
MRAPASAVAASTGSADPTRPAAAFTGSRVVGWVLTVAGGLGLTASLVLTIEKFSLLTDPTYQPSCSINPVISCGSIMSSPQAEAFGFPNPLLGIIGFTVALTTGVVTLAGAPLPRWYWIGLSAGLMAATGFVHWLIFQSLYRIGALCPYCMLVWAVTVVSLWYVLLHTGAGARNPGRPLRRWVKVAAQHHTLVLTVWVLIIAALIAEAFWVYWQTLI